MAFSPETYALLAGKGGGGGGGSSSGIMAVRWNDDVLDHTWQEIFDAIESGKICIIYGADEGYANLSFITAAYIVEDSEDEYPYRVGMLFYDNSQVDPLPMAQFVSAADANDYPGF